MKQTKLVCLTALVSATLGLSMPACTDDSQEGTGTETGDGDGDPGDGDGDPGDGDGDPGDGDPGDGDPGDGDPGDGDPGDGDPGDGDPGDGDPGDGDPGDGDPGDGDGDPGLSFAADIYPILMLNCSCHVIGEPALLGMPDAMTAYDNLVSVPATQEPNLDRVTPGDPDNSYLYQKIAGTQANPSMQNKQMPNTNTVMSLTPLSDPDQMLIYDWIAGGAAP